jgi:hypothetical protein
MAGFCDGGDEPLGFVTTGSLFIKGRNVNCSKKTLPHGFSQSVKGYAFSE